MSSFWLATDDSKLSYCLYFSNQSSRLIYSYSFVSLTTSSLFTLNKYKLRGRSYLSDEDRTRHSVYCARRDTVLSIALEIVEIRQLGLVEELVGVTVHSTGHNWTATQPQKSPECS